MNELMEKLKALIEDLFEDDTDEDVKETIAEVRKMRWRIDWLSTKLPGLSIPY